MWFLNFFKSLFSKHGNAETEVSSDVVVEPIEVVELEEQSTFNTDDLEEIGGVVCDLEDNIGEDEVNG